MDELSSEGHGEAGEWSGPLRAPFPWFGGKRRVAALVWERFGDVANYVEPFFGSGAVLLGRPHAPRIETVNDKYAELADFWRACRWAPERVAEWADWPVNEADLHARHRWLVGVQEDWRRKREVFRRRMLEDPDYFDVKRAGWWLWGLCQWIGTGWCQELHVKRPVLAQGGGRGVFREQLPDLAGDGGAAGRGIHASGRMRVSEKLPDLAGNSGAAGRGIHASGRMIVREQMPFVGGGCGHAGMGIHAKSVSVYDTMAALSVRLRRVRVCCGDWKRVMGPSVTHLIGLTGVFFDPPYSDVAGRDCSIYAEESLTVAHEVREWCAANGDNALLRIALCGYEGEHNSLEESGWTKVAWKAAGGYGGQRRGENVNAKKERMWFSPHCLASTRPEQGSLF